MQFPEPRDRQHNHAAPASGSDRVNSAKKPHLPNKPYSGSMLLRGVGVTRAVSTTVILGAGASRGASFANSRRQVLPPLDADFFQQAQRLDEETFRGGVREVVEFVRDEYGPIRMPTLETVFTQLQGYQQFLQQFSIRPGRRPERYKRQLGYLLELIPLVFRAAFASQQCRSHDRIAYAARKGVAEARRKSEQPSRAPDAPVTTGSATWGATLCRSAG